MPDGMLFLAFVGLAVLGSAVYLFSSFSISFSSHSTRDRHRSVETADAPPRSLAPSAKCTRGEREGKGKDGSALPPSRRRPSITALVTNFLPKSRRGSLVASPPPTTAAVTATSDGSETCAFPPVVNRSKEEIESYGDFPDYAALTGIRLPAPYVGFDIGRALPRPYRPFRWAYHQTMALAKMEPDWWLELENTYVERIQQRKALFAEYGKLVLDYLPGSEAACKELMEMCLEFLVARYPQYFTLTDRHSAHTVFENKILGNQFRIKEMHPLHVVLENIPEDFAITLPDPETGLYEFRAGVICSSLGWTVATKIGLKLHEIHDPIPDYKEKMQMSMDRYFTKLPTNRPIQRGSWGIEVGQPLFMPPGDPHEAHRATQSPTLDLSSIHLRVDWQTLRRLPLSGAIAFNYKALFTPVSEFQTEPYIPQIVSKVLKEGKKSIMAYKSTWHVEHVVLPKLDEWSREQVRDGVVAADWEVETLPEAPFFKGWREKWHRQQGC